MQTKLWPLIEKLAASKTFNFPALMIAIVSQKNCEEVMSLLESSEFPKKLVFTPDVLSSVAQCFLLYTDMAALNSLLPHNPLESISFRPSHWPQKALESFLERGWDEQRPQMRWTSWMSDPTLNAEDLDCVRDYWHTINFESIALLSREDFEAAIESINPLPRSQIMSPKTRIKFMAKSLSLLSFKLRFFDGEDSLAKLNNILNDINTNLEQSHPHLSFSDAFYGLFELIKDGFSSDKILFRVLRDLLAEIVVHLQLRGVWILNVIYIWIKFAQEPTKNLAAGLYPLLNAFFAPEAHATAQDVCTLMRLLNTDAQDLVLMPELGEQVSNLFLSKTSASFQEFVFEECRDELPQFYRLKLPFKLRYHQALTKNRVIQHPSAVDLNVNFGADSVSFVTDLLKNTLTVLNTAEINSAWLNPMNQNVGLISLGIDYPGIMPFPMILERFFVMLLELKHWFVSVGYHDDGRSLLVPALTVPVQILEALGYLMGRAILYGLSLPFVLDLKYFQAREYSLEFCELLIYHFYKYEGVRKEANLFGAYSLTNVGFNRIFTFLDRRTGEFQFDSDDELPPEISEHEQIILCAKEQSGLERRDLVKLMLTGCERLLSGIGEVIPVEDFTIQELHSILFLK